MATELEHTLLEILEVFECGAPDRYGTISNVPADKGGISVGILQASLNSGNLGKLLRAYRNAGGKCVSEEEVVQTEAKDPSQNKDPKFTAMLQAAGKDPIMQRVQDEFFSTMFVKPAEEWCRKRGFVLPLSMAVVLDGCVHGHFYGDTGLAAATPKSLPEKQWIQSYLSLRRTWLANYSNPILRLCVYRPDSFLALIKSSNWTLQKPFVIHGVTLK